MSQVGALVLVTAVGVAGLLVAVAGWAQPAPSLGRALRHLQRVGPARQDPTLVGVNRWSQPLVRALSTRPRLLPAESDLRLCGRTLDEHVAWLLLAAVGGFVAPVLVVGLLQVTGVVGVGWFVAAAVSFVFAVVAPLLVHTTLVERARARRTDLRYQVSAYLDVVTMLLAGNTGYEGALEQASRAGDGQLFQRLRRQMLESGARGASLTDALERTGHELGLEELQQIAATASLSAAEGAPVARTLAAKCGTMRAALATENESEARLRTSRLTTPIVGMALIFMGLVIYPALSFS